MCSGAAGYLPSSFPSTLCPRRPPHWSLASGPVFGGFRGTPAAAKTASSRTCGTRSPAGRAGCCMCARVHGAVRPQAAAAVSWKKKLTPRRMQCSAGRRRSHAPCPVRGVSAGAMTRAKRVRRTRPAGRPRARRATTPLTTLVLCDVAGGRTYSGARAAVSVAPFLSPARLPAAASEKRSRTGHGQEAEASVACGPPAHPTIPRFVSDW